MATRPKSTLHYLLLALIPYSRQNIALAFKPSRFFYDLEKLSNSKQATLRSTLSRAQKNGLVKRLNGIPQLTEAGKRLVKPYLAQKLRKDVVLMVIFDIPVSENNKRVKFRLYLKSLDFRQVQKSVWVTSYDYRNELNGIISELNLKSYVKVYEAAQIKA